MSKVLAVAWREFKYTALTKAFIIGTIIFPFLIWGGMAFASFFFRADVSKVEGTIAIVDPTGDVVRAAMIEFDPERQQGNEFDLSEPLEALDADVAEMEPAEARDRASELAETSTGGGPFGSRVVLNVTIKGFGDEDAFDALRDEVRAGTYLAVAKIDPALLEDESGDNASLSLYVAANANPDHVSAIRRALGESVVRARAMQAGHEVDALRAMLKRPSISTLRLTDVGESKAGIELQQILPIVFMMLLWISSFASGNYLLTTTIEEKSNKVMEVLLSAISPLQLMTGKILGQAVVGLFTISVYGALGIVALSYFAMADLISPMMIVYLIVYFFMAYFMVAALMAGIGSAVSDLQEAHALVTPAMLILFIPLILFVPVSQSPNGTLAVITSFIPPLTPFVMIIRVTSSEPIPVWEIVAATAVGALGVMLMIWLCARIFRVGVLMYGKPPSPWELVKWLRYS